MYKAKLLYVISFEFQLGKLKQIKVNMKGAKNNATQGSRIEKYSSAIHALLDAWITKGLSLLRALCTRMYSTMGICLVEITKKIQGGFVGKNITHKNIRKIEIPWIPNSYLT